VEVSKRLFDESSICILTGSITVIIYLNITKRLNRSQRQKGTFVIPLCMYASTGCLMVITTKIIAILLMETVAGKTHFNNALSYVIWPWWLTLVVLQLTLINVLLHGTEANVIVPLMYVCYASVAMFTSGIFFMEFAERAIYEVFLMLVSISIIFLGVYMVTRNIPSTRGFWPCCPNFATQPTKTLAGLRLGLDEEQEP
jgi:hypothetical protein